MVKRYTGRRWVVSPARREHQVLEELQRADLRVPKAVGFFDGDGGSVVAMERVESDSDLREALHEAESSALGPLIGRLLELVLALHERGWHHRDLYLHHILIDQDGDLVLIDLGRARRKFALDILRRRERMARHQPRHGETEPWEPPL